MRFRFYLADHMENLFSDHGTGLGENNWNRKAVDMACQAENLYKHDSKQVTLVLACMKLIKRKKRRRKNLVPCQPRFSAAYLDLSFPLSGVTTIPAYPLRSTDI